MTPDPRPADAGEVLARVLGECDDPPFWTNLAEDEDALVYECACGDRSPVLAREVIQEADVAAAADWRRAHVAAAQVAALVEAGYSLVQRLPEPERLAKMPDVGGDPR